MAAGMLGALLVAAVPVRDRDRGTPARATAPARSTAPVVVRGIAPPFTVAASGETRVAANAASPEDSL